MKLRIAAAVSAALVLSLAPATAQTIIDDSAREVRDLTLETIFELLAEQVEHPEAASIRGLEQVDEEVTCGEINLTDTEEDGFVQFAYVHVNDRLIVTKPDSEEAQDVSDVAFAARICEEGLPTI